MKKLCLLFLTPNFISKKIIIILSALLFFCCVKNLLSQCTAFPVSPYGYNSVDPPTFLWQNYIMPGCTEIWIARAITPNCPIQGPNPPLIQPFAMLPITQTCLLLSNSEWGNWAINTDYCWGTRVVGGGMNWTPGGHLTRLAAVLPLSSLITPVNGAISVSTMPLMDWSKIDSANNYKLRIYTEACCINVIFDSTTNRDSLRIPSGRLSGNTTYYWKVKPYKTGGEGPFSDPWSFTTMTVPLPPPAPTLVRPPNNSYGMPLTDTLVWNPSSGAASYRLQVAYDAAFSYIFYNDSALTSTSKIFTGLSPLTNYYWRVNAKNTGGTSNWSVVWVFRTKGRASQVTLLVPANNAINIPTTYTFRWSKAYDITTHFLVSNYWFEMVTDTASMANLLRDSALTDTTKLVTGMSNNTSYYWRVKAKNEIGWGNFSVWFKFTTVPAVPASPTLIAPPNGAQGQSLTPLLDWSAVTGASSYRVQVTTDSTFTLINTLDSSNVTGDSLRIPGGRLSNNVKYFWRVNASNAGGTGPWSVMWNFRVGYIGLTQIGNAIPKEYKLYYNYPNPFNPVTKIKFDVPKPDYVSIIIYDILGREIAELVNEQLQPGTYEVDFDGTNYPSGVYYYILTAQSFSQTKRMVLIK